MEKILSFLKLIILVFGKASHVFCYLYRYVVVLNEGNIIYVVFVNSKIIDKKTTNVHYIYQLE